MVEENIIYYFKIHRITKEDSAIFEEEICNLFYYFDVSNFL